MAHGSMARPLAKRFWRALPSASLIGALLISSVEAASPGARALYGSSRSNPAFLVAPDPNKSSRTIGWELGQEYFRPVPLTIPSAIVSGESTTRLIPEFLTWYSFPEVLRLLQLGSPLLRFTREDYRTGLSQAKLDQLLTWNDHLIGVLPSWSTSRYRQYLSQLDSLERVIGSNDFTRVLMNRTAVEHLLRQWLFSDHCLDRNGDDLDDVFWTPSQPCLTGEFPIGSAIAKLNWTPIQEYAPFVGYRTMESEFRASSLPNNAEWDSFSVQVAAPRADQIIVGSWLPGNRLGLTGVHFMLKNQKDWTWSSFWWSPENHSSLNQDQPVTFTRLFPQAPNYSQCTVTADQDSAHSQPTWCSNPYLEKGPGNIRTNCIGCHQFAGAHTSQSKILEQNHTRLIRQNFPSDYVWSYSDGSFSWVRQLLPVFELHPIERYPSTTVR